ncbi:MAG TPA: helix-turn-helix domain-containing protein [Burkholderiaceae bacterium]|nr:helix-turn-helix domain-containing protein [Burkholderiaceae bacterium]
MTTIAEIPVQPHCPLSLPEWQDVVCRTYVSVSCDLGAGEPFEAWLKARTFGVTTLSHVGSTPIRYSRTAKEVRYAPSEDVQLMLVREGQFIVSQGDRCCRLEAGDMTLYDATRPFELEFPERYSALNLKFSRNQLIERLPAATDMTALALRGNTRLASLVASMIRECELLPDDDAPHVMRLSASLLDVVAVAFESAFSQMAPAPSRRQALLRQVQQTIREHLADAEFDMQEVCRRHGIALRTLNRLFASEGTTASRWLWQQRLESSRRALVDGLARNVTEAAYGAGFTDLSHFSRSFRQAFGVLPSTLQRSH